MKIMSKGDGAKIGVRSPYHPSFVARARKLNGDYVRAENVWWFDSRDEEEVRAACLAVYGTTGDDNPPLVDIQIAVKDLSELRLVALLDNIRRVDIQIAVKDLSEQSLFAYGREVLSRPGRDSRVKLGDGVVIVSGSFPSSAGSRNNPKIGGDAVLEIRDVPECLIDADCTVVRRHVKTQPQPLFDVTEMYADDSTAPFSATLTMAQVLERYGKYLSEGLRTEMLLYDDWFELRIVLGLWKLAIVNSGQVKQG